MPLSMAGSGSVWIGDVLRIYPSDAKSSPASRIRSFRQKVSVLVDPLALSNIAPAGFEMPGAERLQLTLIRLLDKCFMTCYRREYGQTRLPDFPSRVSAGVSR